MNSSIPENARISPTGGSGLLVAASAPATAEISESALVPAPIALLGDDACHAWVEFFASHIRNPNTRASYARERVGHLWLVDPDARTLEAFELREGQWLLLATLADDAPVSLPPFDAITFPLDALWPEVIAGAGKAE